MIITRTRPNLHSIGSTVTFHAGANFIRDELFFGELEKNPDFQEQIKVGHLVVDLPAVKEKAKGGQIHKSLADSVASLPEIKAVEVVSKTLDGVDLKEIIRFDKRREVVAAAENQLSNRQNFMNSLQPKHSFSSEPAAFAMGEF